MHVKKILILTIIAFSFVGLCNGQEEPASDPPSGGSEEKTGEETPAESPAAEENKSPSGGDQEKGKEENVKDEPKAGPKEGSKKSSKKDSKETPETEALSPPSPFAGLLEILLPGLKIPAPLVPVALQALVLGVITPGINVKVISFLLAVHFCTDIGGESRS